MNWWKFYQIFQRHDTSDPLSSSRFDTSMAQGAGIVGIDTIPDLRGGGFTGAQSPLRISLEGSADFIDMTSVTGRTARYKEYDRLQMTAEIETALNTFADEACLGGDTLVATPFGFISIAELAETKPKDEQFLVYCWDFKKQDYTLGWAYHPRLVKKAKTVTVIFDDGKKHVCTPDHRFLLRSGEWVEAGDLKYGDELMPFYRVPANVNLTKSKTKQFPRIFTFHDGWKHERQFIDEWSSGRTNPKLQKVNLFGRLFSEGMNLKQVSDLTGSYTKTIDQACQREGFSYREFKWLTNKYPPVRRVIGVAPHDEIDVYDLSVRDHENFATDATIVHNCQEDDQGRIFHVRCRNEEVRKELDYILHRLLQIDDNLWNWAKNLYKYGDTFLEVIIDIENPKRGIVKLQMLPADSMYRIETIKGRLIEFQQSKEGPDYNSLARVDVLKATESELRQATALRFTPEQIIHMKIGDDRRTFYPYGVSMIEAARGPAHLLHLMEDAMLVYRLCLTGDTRIRTAESYKYIKDVRPGDTVFSYTLNGTEEAKVTYWKNNGVQPVYEVRSRHISIKGNATHPVLVNRDGIVQYVDIKDLKPKRDKLLNVTRESNTETIIPRIIDEPWAKLSDEMLLTFRRKRYKNKSALLRECYDFGRAKQFLYCKGKALPLSKAEKICDIFGLDSKKLLIVNKGECNSERINLPRVVDENFARLFGFLCGDGSIGNGHNLGFASSPDVAVNNYYVNLLTQYFGKVRFDLDKRSRIGMGRYVVNSTVACRIFTKMGYINDHHINRIPDWVFTSPKNIRRAFVEGLSDADGCERYTKRGTWFSTIELCNRRLVEDIKEVWSSIGLNSGHIKERTRDNGHMIYDHMVGSNTSYSVTITDCLLPEQENVISVTPIGEEEVFDIGVDRPEHNFIANGTCCHNTRAPERRVFYIDVGQLPPFKAEAFIERMKDQFRKKKVFNRRGTQSGALAVDERYQPPAQDEDYWLPMRQNSNTRIDTLPGACLSLDTKIPLLDGRELTLQDIITEHQEGKELWAYSCCPLTGKLAPGLITWAGVTRKNTEVVRVTFDNGESIVCTPDHKFPVQGKGKTEAKDLKPGDSMFPLRKRMQNLGESWKSKYLQVYDPRKKDWDFVHRIVKRSLKGSRFDEELVYDSKFKAAKKTIIHHKNFNRLDNSPQNLAWMQWDDHKALHNDNRDHTNQAIRDALISYHDNMSIEDKARRDQLLLKLSKKGTNKINELLKKDTEFNTAFRAKQREGWAKSRSERPILHELRGQKISKRNTEFWSDLQRKEQVFAKQRFSLPDHIWERFVNAMQDGVPLKEFLATINSESATLSEIAAHNSHLKRANIDLEKGITISHINRYVKHRGYDSVSQIRVGAKSSTKSESTNIEIVWPESIWSFFVKCINEGMSSDEATNVINSTPNLLQEFVQANAGNFGRGFRFKGKLTAFYIKQMVRSKGYKDCRHLKREAVNYNHKVVSIEYLENKIDTGTLTIDGNHKIHAYHTFAVSCGIFTFNSNLGEIDDALYFRNKLYIALQFPKNYLSNSDPQATRLTLSQQDVRFARLIERLQKPLARAIEQIAVRHLRFRGWPEEEYRDLEVKLTPPSDWRTINRNEADEPKYNRAATMKGAQLMSDYDILVRILGFGEEESKEIVARNKAQRIEELKLQIIGQNPSELGLGSQSDQGIQIGASPGGPTPQLPPPSQEGGGQQPGQEPGPQQGGGEEQPTPNQPGQTKQTQNLPELPEPSEDDIKKYNMALDDVDPDQEDEEVDDSEVDGESI